MTNTKRRIAALEAKGQSNMSSLKVLFVRDGESEEDAHKRAGYPPAAITVVFCSPTDVKL
jgi:hypothetical protein